METITLNRKHKEMGILVVTGKEFTVKPWDQENNVQFFVYDVTREAEYMDKLVEFLSSKGVELDRGSLEVVLKDMREATLGLLDSSKGKSMYTVNVDGDQPVIEFAGYAPEK